MSCSNRTLLQKADLALSELQGGGGHLLPAQAKTFMELLTKQSTLLKQVSVRPMAAPKQQTSQIKFGARVLRPGQEAVPLTQGQRSKPDLRYVELDAKLYKAEIHLSDEIIDDNIEGGAFRQTIMNMMTEAVARDMEELVITGDTTSVDPYLATMDGILKQTQSHVVDAAGAPLSKDLLDDLLRSLPSEYRADKTQLRFFTAVDSEQDYRGTLAERATGVGDKFLEQDVPVMYSGIPLAPIPLFPENLGTNADRTVVLFTHPRNVVVGIWRQIKFETDRDVSAGVLKIVGTIRFDVRLADELATAKAVNVRAS